MTQKGSIDSLLAVVSKVLNGDLSRLCIQAQHIKNPNKLK
jgi:hypothetical protein